MTRNEMPLLADRHNHPLLYSTFRLGVDLSQCGSTSEALELISQFELEKNANQIIFGFGWPDHLGRLPPETLNELGPTVVYHKCLHDLTLNEPGKRWVVERQGLDISWLDDRLQLEHRFQEILNWFALHAATAEGLVDFFEWQRRLGFGFVEEMLLCGARELDLFEETSLTARTCSWASPTVYNGLSANQKKLVMGFKLFADGAIGSRTAAMQNPYSDSRREERGMLLYTDAELAEVVARLTGERKSLAIHAIGDGAIDQVVRVLYQIQGRLDQFPEIRIEHAQLISRGAAESAKRLGLTLCMQPNFNSDSTDYLSRLGADRAAANNPFRMLIDEVGFEPGIDLIFGTDGMPHGAEVAMRQGLFPPQPSQQLTLEELRNGFVGSGGSQGTVCCEVLDEEFRFYVST